MDFELNKMTIDGNGKVHGVMAVNKPVGMTSHDVVNIVRKKYNTRKVGHAGALDPFASGVLMILVGRYTKLSDKLMSSDKEYRCGILFGIETDTLDTEGEVLRSGSVDVSELQEKIDSGALEGLENGYMQQVPIYSSVKVDGQKLRILARKAESHEIDGDFVTFYFENGKEKRIEIPKKEVKFSKFEMSRVEKYEDNKIADFKTPADAKLATMELTVACSKGTYIRQLAKDIGKLLDIPAMLIELERTRISDIRLEQCDGAEWLI
ncbi:tRNA pseudouridine(55) synthase TruB [Candidatus Dojkabacteria bacterium]|nr:tRNA pseudouridine(55) synthase TruB [Candidatus Dojkabacteria bacterium]